VAHIIFDSILILISGVVNVLVTTPLWVVNTKLKMKGIGGHGGSAPPDVPFDGLIGML
jgi:hypothetical protein